MKKLDKKTIEWIESALNHIKDYGDIHIKVHEGRITKVIADAKTDIEEPLTIFENGV